MTGLAILVLAAVGTISGTVRVNPVPAAGPPVKIAKDTAVCGAEAARDRLVVTPDGALANVVVSLKAPHALHTPAPTPNAAIDQMGCRYTPHVQAVTVGTTLSLLNNDAVLHNVHGTLEAGGGPLTGVHGGMPWERRKGAPGLERPGAPELCFDPRPNRVNPHIPPFS